MVKAGSSAYAARAINLPLRETLRAPVRGSGGLFRKLFVAFALATLMSFALGVGFYEFTNDNDDAERDYLSVPFSIAQTLQEEGPEAARRILERDSHGLRVAIHDAEGALLAGTAGLPADADVLDIVSTDGRSYRLSYDLASEWEPSTSVPIFAGLLVSLIISAIVSYYLTRPIALLRAGFRDIGKGDFAIRLAEQVGSRHDEIAGLALEFDRMADQLQRLAATQERLLHDVSHELRSPLARMDVAIGLARRSPLLIEEGILDRMQREVDRLDKLIGEILTLARLNSGAAGLNLMKLDVVDLVQAIVEDAEFEASTKQCTIACLLPANFITRADGELLYRAYENVIRNAVKYAPAGSAVSIAGEVTSEAFVVAVSDNGPGVPPEMMDAIFAPFCRAPGDSISETIGSGLGLAIARQAMHRHHGKVWAEPANENGMGLRVTLSLPIKSDGSV